jgi:hypothetical protein
MHRFLALALLVSAPFAAGCSVPQQGNTGDLGKLNFQVQKADCVLFCGDATSTPLLAGATIDVLVANGDPSTTYSVALTPPSLAQSTLTTTYWCNSQTANSASVREVSVSDKCNANETKSVTLTVSLSTVGAGDLGVSIVGPSGTVDKTTLHLDAAASVSGALSNAGGAALTPAADGAFEVHTGAVFSIASSAKDAAGDALVYTRGAYLFSYANTSIVASSPNADSGVENAVAVAPGTTNITVAAGVGATHTFAIRVLP